MGSPRPTSGPRGPRAVKLRDLLVSGEHVNAAAYMALALGAFPFVSGLVFAAADRKWVEALSFLVPLAGAAGFCFQVSRRHAPIPVDRGETFDPFSDLTLDSAWRREDDENRVLHAFFERGAGLPVIVGASGVGKSTLIQVLVAERLKTEDQYRNSVAYECLVEYAAWQTAIERKLAHRPPDRYYVLVLDQFEQWLAQTRELGPHERTVAQETLRAILETSARSANYTVAISLRKEWYYELAFLGTLVPSPARVCSIQGPRRGDSRSEMRKDIIASFASVTGDQAFAQYIADELGQNGRISPLESNLVGATLKQWVNEGDGQFGVAEFNQRGGVAAAIEQYFSAEVEGDVEPVIASKVLCALSLRTRFRLHVPRGRVKTTLFEDDTAATRSIDYLIERKLVRKHDGGHLSLAHDYLAEYFQRRSGADVHPIERDNILVHADLEGGINDAVLMPHSPVLRARRRFGVWIAVAASLFMFIRLLDFGIDWTVLGPSVSQPAAHNLLDAAYVTTFVPQVCWSVYVGLFYDRLLIRLNESGAARSMSLATLWFVLIGALLGALVPATWILGIAAAGGTIAAKLLALARRQDLNKTAKDRLKEFGLVTLGNMIAVLMLGGAEIYLTLHLVNSRHDARVWLIWNIPVSLLITYGALSIAPIHVGRGGISRLLGLIGRPKHGRLIRAEV